MSSGSSATRLRRAAFDSPAIKAALLPGSAVDASSKDALVGTLRIGVDDLLAGEYVHTLLQAMSCDKKGKKLPEVRTIP